MAHLEGSDFVLGPRMSVNVPPGDVHGFSFSPGTQGFVATLADEMRKELPAQAGDVCRAAARSRILSADEQIVATMQQIGREYADRRAARALVMRGLCASLLGLTARATAKDEHAERHLGNCRFPTP